MNMTKWCYIILAIAENPVLAKKLAQALAADSGDANAFERGANLVALTGNKTAKFVQTPATSLGNAAVAEFNSAGPYTILNARGITTSEVLELKECTYLYCSHVDTMEYSANSFIESKNFKRA